MVWQILAPAMVSAGAALTSGLFSTLGGEKAAGISAEAAKRNTQAQINWERERAQNAHQWEISDMEKAGINPILSAGGSGAATGGISPQMPDTSGITQGYNQAAQAIANSANMYNQFLETKKIENDSQRILNETKQTNSDLSLKGQQMRIMIEEQLNKAAERGLIKQKKATEIKNQMKLQSDIELQQNQMILNEQLRGKYETEMNYLDQQIKNLQAELDLNPERKRRIQLENELEEKENKIYYIRETVNELSRISSVGLGVYGAYQANNAISAYKANNKRTSITNRYDKRQRLIGTTEQFYK